jgi:hypothetical protein
MKMLVKIIIVIVVIVAIPLIMALFIKKEYSVEREIVIQKPKQEVFNYVKFIKNQDYYNKWVMTDPNMKRDFKGTDGTVGFIYEWNGNEAGEGAQEITKIIDSERMEMELRFVRPFVGIGYAHMATNSISGNTTKVKWGMKGENPYPRNFINLFVGSMLGKDMDTSLNNLKNILEKK